jgi:hypothetical protein
MTALSLAAAAETRMPDPTDKKDPIKVVDRRSFTPDGRRRTPEEAPAPEGEAAARPASEPRRPAAAAAPGPAAPQADRPRDAHHGTGFTMEPPSGPETSSAAQDAAFGNLVISLYQSGCIHLGLAAEEGAPPQPVDLEGARGAIEMLLMLRSKTRGNLAPDESRILDTLIAEMQMAYAMKARGA